MIRIIHYIIISLSLLIAHGDDSGDGGHNHGHSHKHQNLNKILLSTGSIQGIVISSETQEIIPITMIEVYESKSDKLIQSGITDEDGFFNITDLAIGHYFITLGHIGYETVIKKDIYINLESGMKKDLGTIFLSVKAINADQISIIDDTPTIEVETDKLVYTPSEDILATGGSAEDVLNNVPMVLVDQDGAVSLKGSSNVKILVNGRENRMGEGGNDVDDIPASMIEKVEVITSPSAKYDPEGMAGIINIILKKGSDKGFHAQVKVFSKSNEYHDFNEMGGGTLSGNYKTNNYNLYGSYSNKIIYRDRNGYRYAENTYTDGFEEIYNEELNETTIQDLPDSVYIIDFRWLSKKKRNNQVLKLGTDYYLNDQLTFNIEGRYNSYYSMDTSIDTTIQPKDEILTHSDIEPKGNYEMGISIGVDKTYDNPDKNLSLFYSFDRHPKDIEYDIVTSNLWLVNDYGDEDTTKTISKLQSHEFKASYSYPIDEKSKFEFGYEFDQTYNNETMNYILYVDEGGECQNFENDFLNQGACEENNNIWSSWEASHIEGENSYTYQRDIHGAFAEYSVELNEKWSIKPGVRFEYVNKNIYFKGTPDAWYLNGQEFLNEADQDGYLLCEVAKEECIQGCDESIVDCMDFCGDCELTENPSNELGPYAQILRENNNTDIDDSYTSVYPSFHVTYNLSDKKSLQFAISSRVERPGGGHHGGSRQIRPFPRDIHSKNFIFVGNPELKPQYSTNYELSYKSPIMSKSSKRPMGFFYTNVYYEYIIDKIEWYSGNQYEFDILTFRNANKGKGYGLELFFMLFGQTLGGGFWYNEVNDGSEDKELNGTNKGLNSYGKINLPERYIKYFGFEFGYYYMKMIDDYGSMFGDKGSIWANLGFTKSLFKKQAKLSFKIDNIFNSGGFSLNRTKPLVLGIDYIPNNYYGGSEYSDMESSRNGRTYSITFQYNFGDEERHKKIREREKRSGGMNMGM